MQQHGITSVRQALFSAGTNRWPSSYVLGFDGDVFRHVACVTVHQGLVFDLRHHPSATRRRRRAPSAWIDPPGDQPLTV